MIIKWRPMPSNSIQVSAYSTHELTLWVHVHQSWILHQWVIQINSSHKHGKHTWRHHKVTAHRHHAAPVAHSCSHHIKHGLAHCKSNQPQLLILFKSSASLKVVLGLLTLHRHYIHVPASPVIRVFSYRLSNMQQLCHFKTASSQNPKWLCGLTPRCASTEHLHRSCPTPFLKRQRGHDECYKRGTSKPYIL